MAEIGVGRVVEYYFHPGISKRGSFFFMVGNSKAQSLPPNPQPPDDCARVAAPDGWGLNVRPGSQLVCALAAQACLFAALIISFRLSSLDAWVRRIFALSKSYPVAAYY